MGFEITKTDLQIFGFAVHVNVLIEMKVLKLFPLLTLFSIGHFINLQVCKKTLAPLLPLLFLVNYDKIWCGH